jgi:outer membrane biosynthesis protein TonB
LYVAEESLEEYKKKRKAFENYVLVGTVFIVIIFTFSVLSPLISGDINRAISMFFASLGLSFLIIFLILFSYMPAIEDKLTVIEKEKRQEEEGQEGEKGVTEVKEEIKEKEELREEEKKEEGVKEEKEMVLAKEKEKKTERKKIEKKVEKPKKVKKRVRKAKKKE